MKQVYTERQYWQDLWSYRELFFFLAWRDILVRYKQTVIGILWGIIIAFADYDSTDRCFRQVGENALGRGCRIQFLSSRHCCPGNFLQILFRAQATRLITNTHLISKVYFPRLVIPASSVVVSFVDFLISLAILFVLMIWYDFWPTWRIIGLPFFIIVAIGVSPLQLRLLDCCLKCEI